MKMLEPQKYFYIFSNFSSRWVSHIQVTLASQYDAYKALFKISLVWLVFWMFVPPDWLWLPPGRVWPALWSQSRPLRSCLHSVSALRAQPGQGRHQGNSGESRERHRMRYNETNRNNTTPPRDSRETPLSQLAAAISRLRYVWWLQVAHIMFISITQADIYVLIM